MDWLSSFLEKKSRKRAADADAELTADHMAKVSSRLGGVLECGTNVHENCRSEPGERACQRMWSARCWKARGCSRLQGCTHTDPCYL